MGANQLQRQPVNPPHDGQEAGWHLPPSRRRVKLPEGHGPLVPGKVPLQSRAQRALLQAEDVVHGVRDQALRRTGESLSLTEDNWVDTDKCVAPPVPFVYCSGLHNLGRHIFTRAINVKASLPSPISVHT